MQSVRKGIKTNFCSIAFYCYEFCLARCNYLIKVKRAKLDYVEVHIVKFVKAGPGMSKKEPC